MKLLLIAIMVLTIAVTAQAQLWDVIVDGVLMKHNIGEPHHSGYWNMTREQHALFQEYEVEYIGEAQAGYHLAGHQWVGVLSLMSRYQNVFEADVPIDPSEVYPSPDITVPMMDSSNVVGTARLLVDSETMEVAAVINTASPQHPWSAQLAAWRADRDARAAALAGLNLTQAQIDAVQAYFAADVDTLFSGLSVGQRRFLNVQRALVKALVKREIKELR